MTVVWTCWWRLHLAMRIPLTERFSELLGRKVDLIPEHDLNRYIRDTIRKIRRIQGRGSVESMLAAEN